MHPLVVVAVSAKIIVSFSKNYWLLHIISDNSLVTWAVLLEK